MKKILGIIILGLLLSGNAYATILSTAEQKKLISNGTIKKGMTQEYLELTISPSVWSAGTVSIFNLKKSGIKVWCSCGGMGYCFDGKANKKNSKLIQIWEDPNEMADYWLKKASHKKNIKQINIFKSDLIKYPNYCNQSDTVSSSASSTTASSGSSSMSTKDKITQAKQICTDLGFQPKTEKHADCSMQMMSIQFETTNKVSSASGGTTQEVIVTHRNDYDIWDALLDFSAVIQSNNKSTTSSSSSNNRGTNCVVGRTNPTFGTTTINCN